MADWQVIAVFLVVVFFVVLTVLGIAQWFIGRGLGKRLNEDRAFDEFLRDLRWEYLNYPARLDPPPHERYFVRIRQHK